MKPITPDLTPLLTKSWWRQAIGSAYLLFKGMPQKEEVHLNYNALRQEYILDAARHHFKKRADDPAPLYGKTLLDVGCGVTPINAFMVLSGADVTAIDINPEKIERAQGYTQSIGTQIDFKAGTIADLIPEEKKYDVILCLDLLEYVTDTEHFFWAVQRLLKPKGLLVFSAINKNYSSWILHILLSEFILKRTEGERRHWRGFYKPQHMRKLMQKHSFNVSTIQGLQFETSHKKWTLSHTPGTRYLGIATKI